MAFGSILTARRRALNLSQQELALRCGLSQRHVSFLETGRARPGRMALAKIIDGLALAGPEAGELLGAAGLRPKSAPLDWDDAGFAPARAALERILAKHEPWPAFARLAGGDLLLANRGLENLLRWASPDRCLWQASRPGGRPNIYDLSLHPAGLPRFMAEPGRLAPHLLARLRRAARLDGAAMATLRRVRGHPAARAASSPLQDRAPAAVLSERYIVRGERLAFVATIAGFGAAEDARADGIAIEMLVPADAATETLAARIAD